MHGYGVVATRPISAGAIIAEVDGHLWRDEDEIDDTYSLFVEDGVYYDMLDQTRWINHSCEPNAEVEAELGADGQGEARLIALRDIVVGEEITYDYAFPAELAEPCNCGAKTCRGFIVDPDDLPRLTGQRRRRRRLSA